VSGDVGESACELFGFEVEIEELLLKEFVLLFGC
jgi:hypothetical protein